jgi:(2Fe-2S) ferredoxin
MDNQRIARELLAVARELVAKAEKVGRNGIIGFKVDYSKSGSVWFGVWYEKELDARDAVKIVLNVLKRGRTGKRRGLKVESRRPTSGRVFGQNADYVPFEVSSEARWEPEYDPQAIAKDLENDLKGI